MTCLIIDNDIYVRARQFTASDDFVWHMRKERLQDNRFFNLETMYTCPVSVADENMISCLTEWKRACDDICPVNVNGTYLAGNHGYFCVDRITVTEHDKTEADIGSVWKDAKGKTYVLAFIYNENALGFIMFNDDSMSTGKMKRGIPEVGTDMVHVSGASNTNSVTIEEVKGTQMWKCWNHYTLRLLVDGIEQDLNVNQVLAGNRIEMVTEYNVIFIPAMLNYLMKNVGKNSADSQNSEQITDYYLKMVVTYQFNRNGSLSQYSSFYINKEMDCGYVGLVQSFSLGPNPYTYIPDTSYDVLTLHDGSATQRFSRDLWRSTEKAPYRYYQFTDETADKGVCLVYERSIGRGENAQRLDQLEDAGMFFKSTKMYPSFISGGTLTPNTFFNGMAARIPLYKYDEDVTCVGWYWCCEDIIFMIDTHEAADKDIVLPDYMNNMRVEVLDKTDSCNVVQSYIFNSKLRFQCTGYGYAVLRFYQ